jgi:hypothetical protein
MCSCELSSELYSSTMSGALLNPPHNSHLLKKKSALSCQLYYKTAKMDSAKDIFVFQKVFICAIDQCSYLWEIHDLTWNSWWLWQTVEIHIINGRAVPQAVSSWLPTAAAWVRAQVKSCWMWWTKQCWGRFSRGTSVSLATHFTDCFQRK